MTEPQAKNYAQRAFKELITALGLPADSNPAQSLSLGDARALHPTDFLDGWPVIWKVLDSANVQRGTLSLYWNYASNWRRIVCGYQFKVWSPRLPNNRKRLYSNPASVVKALDAWCTEPTARELREEYWRQLLTKRYQALQQAESAFKSSKAVLGELFVHWAIEQPSMSDDSPYRDRGIAVPNRLWPEIATAKALFRALSEARTDYDLAVAQSQQELGDDAAA